MANSLLSKAPSSKKVLVLTGNLHARRTPIELDKAPYAPMASFLPSKQTITLTAQADGGTA